MKKLLSIILIMGYNILSAQGGSTILINNVQIFNGKEEKTTIGNVLIIDNIITKISSSPIPINKSGNTKIIDGKGKFLMPGLIDVHMHLIMSACTQEELMAPGVTMDFINEKAKIEAKGLLMRGYTSIRDVGGPVFDMKRQIDAKKTEGPRIYPSGGMISQTSGHGDFRLPSEKSRRFGGQISHGELMGFGFIADGRDEVLTATRENLRSGATQIKLMAGGGAATVYDPLDVAQYTLDELKAAVEAADDWGTYVTVHAYTPKAVKRAIEAGVKCIEHGQLLDEESMKILADKGIWLSLQALDEAPATQPKDIREKKHKVVQGTANAFTWAKKYNIKLAFGTDYMFNPTGNKNQNKDYLKLKDFLTPFEILKMATHDNAQLLTLSGERNPYKEGKLGVIEEGAYADMILVDGNPLQNLDLVGNPEKNFVVIIKDGVVYKNTLK
ncbi:amidohydrolase family protein [Flavobacterium sp.]|uniref:metal-dependent hydrolase family protein n=1 Tax=Flavobacterium sp. TaxID=239 RepID=UPI00286A4BCB|nr:amidohydrolase family protein [Flavobacterium sp.]